MLKLVIFDGYGSSAIPDKIAKKVEGKKFIEIRTKILVEFIESLPDLSEEEFINKGNKIQRGECVRTRNTIIYFNKDDYFPSRCTIVEVDTSRPWTIGEYDGAEYIEYLDYEIVDEEYNYAKRNTTMQRGIGSEKYDIYNR